MIAIKLSTATHAVSVLALAVSCSGKVAPLGDTGITPLAPPPATVGSPSSSRASRLCLQDGASPKRMLDDYVDFVSLAVDRDYVYYETLNDRRLGRVPKSGGPPETLSDVDVGQALLNDGSALYVGGFSGKISVIPSVGPSTLSRASNMIGVDAQSVFLIFASDEIDSRLIQVPKSGREAAFAVPGQAGSVLIDGDTMYWTEGVWSGALRAVEKGDATSRLVFEGPVRAPSGFAVDDDAVYVAQDNVGIARVPKTGEVSTPLAANAEAQAVYLDGDFVYWTDEHAITKTPKKGGPSIPIVAFDAGAFMGWGLAIDEDCVYFTVDPSAASDGSYSPYLMTVRK
jgi:hypothetical protein